MKHRKTRVVDNATGRIRSEGARCFSHCVNSVINAIKDIRDTCYPSKHFVVVCKHAVQSRFHTFCDSVTNFLGNGIKLILNLIHMIICHINHILHKLVYIVQPLIKKFLILVIQIIKKLLLIFDCVISFFFLQFFLSLLKILLELLHA